MRAQWDAVAGGDREERPEAAVRDETLVGVARGDLLRRLSSGLVHEARNPLNAMAIHLEVLADKLTDEASGEVPAHLARNLDAARNQVRRLDELLRRYGEFAGGRVLKDALASCLERTVELAEYHLRRAGLEAQVEVAGDVAGEMALPAPEQLCQALLQVLLVAAGRLEPGSAVQIVGRRAGAAVEVCVAGSMAKEPLAAPGDAESDALALEGAAAIARLFGGEIAMDVGERWSWTLRLPVDAPPTAR